MQKLRVRTAINANMNFMEGSTNTSNTSFNLKRIKTALATCENHRCRIVSEYDKKSNGIAPYFKNLGKNRKYKLQGERIRIIEFPNDNN